jgi:serine/threonine-protein phosphatase PP1 catalytic subunit
MCDAGVADKNNAMDGFDKRGLSGRLRRVRRKAGSDQLSAQGDSMTTTPARKYGHVRSQTWGSTTVASSDTGAVSMLRSIQRNDLDGPEKRKRDLEEMRALWEATLPKPVKVCMGHHSPERS